MAEGDIKTNREEQDQSIRDEYTELIRRGDHDTEPAVALLSIKYQRNREEILNLIGMHKPTSGQPRDTAEHKEEGEQDAKQGTQAEPAATVKLSRADMDSMNKTELLEHAASIGIDTPSSATKADIIDAIAREQRRR